MTTNAGGLKGDIVATIASASVSEEEALTQATISDELRLIDGIEIEANGNPILAEMAALAHSDDLVNTQRSIVAYESGDASFYRSLHRILNIGKIIMQSDAETIAAAFSYLSDATKNENTISKDSRAVRNRGLKNIGETTLPVINEMNLKRIKEDSLFLYKILRLFLCSGVLV
jgi:hypothetical protein